MQLMQFKQFSLNKQYDNSTLKKSIGPSPLRIIFLLIPLALICLLAPMAQAVTPAPDGGYPGQNTAEGDNALLNLTSGIFNTAVGFQALLRNIMETSTCLLAVTRF